MFDKNKLSNYFGVSVIIIYFEFYHQKDKLFKYADKIGPFTIPMHLNDNRIG